jgi:hypothetical protein
MQERRDEFAAYRIDVNDRITKLREALEFYANPENCKPALTSRVGAFTGIARAVLDETK